MILMAAIGITAIGSVYSRDADTGARLNPPTGLTADAGYQKVLLKWRATTSSAEADYNIYQSARRKGPFQKVATTPNEIYTVTNLTNGTTYYFKVTASLNASAESDYSNQATATPGLKQ
jgi:fibronectin type 3 domain-containing protein